MSEPKYPLAKDIGKRSFDIRKKEYERFQKIIFEKLEKCSETGVGHIEINHISDELAVQFTEEFVPLGYKVIIDECYCDICDTGEHEPFASILICWKTPFKLEESPIDDICPICHDDIDYNFEYHEKCASCKKYYHERCINQYKESIHTYHNINCPACKQPFKLV